VPGIVIVQHMPEQFTLGLRAAAGPAVGQIRRASEASDGDRVIPGRALIAPGGKHLQLQAQRRAVLRGGEGRAAWSAATGPVGGRAVPHRWRTTPAAMPLGIIMTGMGDDGARGLLEMRKAGAITIAQDEASCVVFGMPKEAIKLGAAQQVVPLDDLADLVAGRRRARSGAAAAVAE
jgi:two-component system chemotaxis response regulator CheB